MGELKSIGWNAVVVGKWNPAILTPKGIADQIFRKPADYPIEVLVPVNAMGPIKVRIEGFLVSADFERLIIDCEKSDWENLEKAREYCCQAIDTLPKTPVTAAGFNIRYELEEPSEDFIEILNVPLDSSLSDNRLEIVGRETRRSFSWEKGTVNLHVIKPKSGNYKILMNFDIQSINIEELKEWLTTPIDKVKDITKTIICSVFNICEEGDI